MPFMIYQASMRAGRVLVLTTALATVELHLDATSIAGNH
jgi:hypothetical protein